MSRFFGEIRQVAYLVPDIEAAMDYWARELGVGPWYYNPRVPIENYTLPRPTLRAAQFGGARQRGPPADRAAADAQRRAVDVPRLPRAPVTPACSTSPTGPSSSTRTWRAPQRAGFKVCMSGEVGANGRFVYFEPPDAKPVRIRGR